MNHERLMKMAGAVRTGGKGSMRRKKKAAHKATTTVDKRLQSTLKRLGVNDIPAIEEVNIFKDDIVIQFPNPKVQASITANTWVVSGTQSSSISPEDVITPATVNQLRTLTPAHAMIFCARRLKERTLQLYFMDTSSGGSNGVKQALYELTLPSLPVGGAIPYSCGFAAIDKNLYLIGGKSADNAIFKKTFGDDDIPVMRLGPPLNTLWIYNIETCRWSKGNNMKAGRKSPLVIVSNKKIYVFGGRDPNLEATFAMRDYKQNWAELYDIQTQQWLTLSNVPDELYSTLWDVFGHAVLRDDQIILWNYSYFFYFNVGLDKWVTVPHYGESSDALSCKGAVVDNIFYWFSGDSVFAYDLHKNEPFSDRLFKIDCSTGTPLNHWNMDLFAAREINRGSHELYLLWFHSYDKKKKKRFVCGKVRIDKSSSEEVVTLQADCVDNCFEYYNLPPGTRIEHCFGLAGSRDYKEPQSSMAGDPYGSLRWDEEVGKNHLEKLFIAMCNQTGTKEMDDADAVRVQNTVKPTISKAGKVQVIPKKNMLSKKDLLERVGLADLVIRLEGADKSALDIMNDKIFSELSKVSQKRIKWELQFLKDGSSG